MSTSNKGSFIHGGYALFLGHIFTSREEKVQSRTVRDAYSRWYLVVGQVTLFLRPSIPSSILKQIIIYEITKHYTNI